MTIGLIRLGFSLTPPDVTAPTVPTGLVAAPGDTTVALSWTASTDSVGVVGYKVYKGGTFLKNVTGVSTTDTGLTNGTGYVYSVSAYDAAGNESAQATFATVVPYVTWIKDTFTRTSGAALGSTETGAKAWNVLPAGDASMWAIASNGLQKLNGVVPSPPNLCSIDSGRSDGTITVTTLSGTTVGAGIFFRGDATAANGFLWARDTAGKWSLKRRTAGAYTTLFIETTGTAAAGDVPKVVLNGTSIKCYKNGTLLYSATDSQGVTNTIEGVWASSSAVCNFDGYEHNSLTA